MIVFNKKQLTTLIKIMEQYDLSDVSEWYFPLADENKDYFCELCVPVIPGHDRFRSVIVIKSLER